MPKGVPYLTEKKENKDMSVVKSKQYIASTQFLSNLQKLEKEVLAWCKSQGNKNTSYGLSALFETTNKAFINAFQANKTYLKDEDSLLLRKQYLDNSIRWLHNFNAQLTALLSCYNISNTKIKRWMCYVHQAINQMESVKKSDSKRLKKK